MVAGDGQQAKEPYDLARPRTWPGTRVLVRPGAPTGATPHPPSSKYYTLRYLLTALLADGESTISDPARSDDTDVLVAALGALGAAVAWRGEPPALWVRGCAGRPRAPADGVVRVGNAGAVLRLLLGVGALLPEVRFETDHPDSLGTRPNADLLAALAQLGIHAEAREPGGRLPITLRGGPPPGGAVSVSGARSSQYLSALLYLAPLTARGLRISVTDELRSAPLVRATLRALGEAGIQVTATDDLRAFTVAGGQVYRPRAARVPGDGPSAAALVAAALALDAPLRLERLDAREDDVAALLAALAALGAPLAEAPAALAGDPPARVLVPGARLRGARVDGDGCIDSVPVLAAAACFAAGESRFERVATLRLKESDRLGDLAAELTRAGADVRAEADALVVRGRPEGIAGGATVDAHQDHRLAQALAIVALRSRHGLTITSAAHVAKSYPWFFADLAAMGAEVVPLADG
ncbi:MAG TPA: 3-phosphoshikimate 1-carboxyvinyltransferase [Ktedonobacterales bacterium]|jgi:3-phosphoshikimate 1-carboxyvinyltransferase